MQAVKDKHRGKLSYMFRMPEGGLLEAFEDQKQVLLNADGTATDTVKNLMTDFSAGVRSYGETMMRLVCTIVYMRLEFLKMWQQYDPLIRIEETDQHSSEDMADGSKLITTNGFKFIGARANEKTKKRLGLC